jgi:hypothetical protein
MNRKLKLLVAVIAAFAGLATVAAAASSPTVATQPATSVTTSSGVLHGTVNPNAAKTVYVFQWGLTTGYGNSSRARSAGAGVTGVPVSLVLRRLLPGTVYHYRLVALSPAGGAIGRDRSFKTKGNPPPYAATGPTTLLTSSTATVTAVINPNNQKTTWYFQYGLSSAYSSQTIAQTLPAGSAPVTVSQQLQGLSPGTIFHYRIVAVNRGVVERGADAIFMTYPAVRPAPRVRARTIPHHARFRPFVFTTSGRVIGPSTIPGQFSCSGGSGEVRFFLGKRRVARKFVPVQPNCTFAAQTVFNHRPGHRHGRVRLRVLAQFLGNGYLAPNRARIEHVSVG